MIKILFVNLKGSDNMEKNNTKQPIWIKSCWIF